MGIIPAVVTEDARKYWPQFFGGLMGVPGAPTVPGSPPSVWDPRISFFKVGEGGWVDPGGGAIPRTPDPALRKLTTDGVPPVYLQDLDAVVDPTRPLIDQRYLASSRASFKKDLSISSMLFLPPSTIEVQCLLDYADFNDDGFGNSPEIWEIGLFSEFPEAGSLASDQGLMIAYGTFPKEEKDVTKQILNVVRITF